MYINAFDKENILNVSRIMNENKSFCDLRLKAFDFFESSLDPDFCPFVDVNFANINYNANNNIDFICENKDIIFCSLKEAFIKHFDLIKKYFNNLVKYDENKYTALNNMLWSNGIFIYIPANLILDKPLKSIINILDSQFDRTLIIVDENSELEYIEELSSSNDLEAFHLEIVEVYLMKNAKCSFITNQNLNNKTKNVAIKRANVSELSLMEWHENHTGSNLLISYPTCLLNAGSTGKYYLDSVVCDDKTYDIGFRMKHLGNNSNSFIEAKTVVKNNASMNFKNDILFDKNADNSNSNVNYISNIKGKKAKSYITPNYIYHNNNSTIKCNSKIS